MFCKLANNNVLVSLVSFFIFYLNHWVVVSSKINKDDELQFPKDFLFGTATAAYQVEGGWNEGGRQPSIWDFFCRERGLQCANVADDFFHRYKSDIKLMKDMGLSSFRFSFSWSRVMSWDSSTKTFVRNPAGIAFYSDLIDEMKAVEIEPLPTMYHWDLPLPLHTEFSPSGWLNSGIVAYFNDFSKVLFEEFGHRIKYWATFNEPLTFVQGGYETGFSAPGMNNSSTNVYIAAHNVLLSHAEAVSSFREYKKKNIVKSDALITMALNDDFNMALNPDDPQDVAAAERTAQFSIGWYLQPMLTGDYPEIMKQFSGSHLPVFTLKEKLKLKGSIDILMLNHYGTSLVTDCNSSTSQKPCDTLTSGWTRDLGVDNSRFPKDSRPASVGPDGKPNCEWFAAYPEGYLAAIRWLHKQAPHLDILLTENGWCGNSTINNHDQIWYFESYLSVVLKTISEGIPVIGYTAWSLMDNYEWGSYVPRFGLYYVEYPQQVGCHDGYDPKPSDLKRIPRPAVHYLKEVVSCNCVPSGLKLNFVKYYWYKFYNILQEKIQLIF